MEQSVNKKAADKKFLDIFFIVLLFGALLRLAIGIGD